METPSTKSQLRALATLRAFLRTRLTPASDEVKKALDVISASAEQPETQRSILQTFLGLQKVLREAEGADNLAVSSWGAQRSALAQPISAEDGVFFMIVTSPVLTNNPLVTVESSGPTRSTWHPMAFVVSRGDLSATSSVDTYLRVSADTNAMYRLSEDEDGRGVTSFSSAGPADITDWPPRVLAILYVRDMGEQLRRYEAYMATLTTPRIANILGLQDSGIGGLLSILVNSPDGRQYVPAEPAAWEKEALQEDEAKSAGKRFPWGIVGIGAAVALVIGVVIVAMWPAQYRRRRLE